MRGRGGVVSLRVHPATDPCPKPPRHADRRKQRRGQKARRGDPRQGGTPALAAEGGQRPAAQRLRRAPGRLGQGAHRPGLRARRRDWVRLERPRDAQADARSARRPQDHVEPAGPLGAAGVGGRVVPGLGPDQGRGVPLRLPGPAPRAALQPADLRPGQPGRPDPVQLGSRARALRELPPLPESGDDRVDQPRGLAGVARGRRRAVPRVQAVPVEGAHAVGQAGQRAERHPHQDGDEAGEAPDRRAPVLGRARPRSRRGRPGRGGRAGGRDRRCRRGRRRPRAWTWGRPSGPGSRSSA